MAIKQIEDRRSVRKFKPGQTLTAEQAKQLLDAAMRAPSACNSRPWEFIVVTDKGKLADIAKIHPYAQMCLSASAAIIVVAIPQTGMPEGYFPQDCGAATQNILLEACAMGLGTCWCGVYPKRERIGEMAALFDIGEPKLPFNVIAVGVPDETPAARGFYDESKVRFV